MVVVKHFLELLKQILHTHPQVVWFQVRTIIGGIFLKLFPFLVDEKFESLHKPVKEIIKILLKLLSGRLNALRIFISDSLTLLEDLNEVLHYFINKRSEEESKIVIKCYKRFEMSLATSTSQLSLQQDAITNDNESNIENREYLLDISTISHCNTTIMNINEVISTQYKEIPQFISDISLSFPSLLLFQISIGNFYIKKVALKSLKIYLQNSIEPLKYLHTNLFHCLINLFAIYPSFLSCSPLDSEKIDKYLSWCTYLTIDSSPHELLHSFSFELLHSIPFVLEKTKSDELLVSFLFLLKFAFFVSLFLSICHLSFCLPIFSLFQNKKFPFKASSFAFFVSLSLSICPLSFLPSNLLSFSEYPASSFFILYLCYRWELTNNLPFCNGGNG